MVDEPRYDEIVTDDELKGLFKELREEMQQGNAMLRQEMQQGNAMLRQEMQQGNTTLVEMLRQEMQQGNATLAQTLRQENAEAHAETRRLIGVSEEANRHEIKLLAEGLVNTREELDRKIGQLDQKIDNTTAETHALIRFLHADLRSRVERLESITH